MKRKSWMLGVLFVLIILVSYMAKPEKTQNDLLLMNIEALAVGEDYVPIQCIGTGTVDCPLGGKTKFVMILYQLIFKIKLYIINFHAVHINDSSRHTNHVL